MELTPASVLQINISGGGTEQLHLATTTTTPGETFELISGAFGGTGLIVHS